MASRAWQKMEDISLPPDGSKGGVLPGWPKDGSVVGSIDPEECVLGPDRVCRRTDAEHAKAEIPSEDFRFWACPLHGDADPRLEGSDQSPEPSEMVEHPSHYGGGDNPYEVRKVIRSWGLGFSLGNAVKYIARAGKKDPAKHIEDLEKAVFYLNDEIAHLKETNEQSA